MKNSKRINPFRSSAQSDRHCTGVLAYGMEYTNKSKGGISI